MVSIRMLAVIAGGLPSRALGLVIEWASLHREELHAPWEKATDRQPLGTISPLV